MLRPVMTLTKLLMLGLTASVALSSGCRLCRDECGNRPGLFGWRDRARERELARERERDLDPTRPRLEAPIRPRERDRIPPPEIPTGPGPSSGPPGSIPDTRYRIPTEFGPSPGSWVGPMLDVPRRSEKIVLEPDPIPQGAGLPPLELDLPRESSRVPSGLEAPIPPVRSERALPIEAQPLPRLEPPMENIPPLPKIEQKAEKPALEAPIKPSFSGSVLPELFTVPGFTDVYSGRKPTLEGFTKLKQNGVRTVIYLHSPQADMSAPRSLAEKSGLQFEPIEVSPATLAVARRQFSQLIQESSRRPVFVYDENGSRAGVLWYLYFREQQFSDDLAKLRAGSLGLNNLSNEPAEQQLWQAARDLVR